MGLEAGEPFGVVARSSVIDTSFESEDTFDKVHDLVETPLEGSHDVLVHDWSPGLGFDDNVFPNLLDHFHISPICSLPPLSPEYYIDVPIDNPKICDSNVYLGHASKTLNLLGGNVDSFLSLGYFCGYDASLDLYCIFLVDKPRKIM